MAIALLVSILAGPQLHADFRADLGKSDHRDSSSTDCNVAVIPLHGGLGIDWIEASEDTGGEPIIASGDVVSLIQAAAADEGIRAIVLDVNSPGGSPVAADEIERALQVTDKPTVSLVREQALSGGYLAAAGADTVVASRYALVGGLGVTASYLDETGASEREGSVFQQLSTGMYKDIGNPDKPLTEEERELIMNQLKSVHQLLVHDISRLRRLPTTTVAELANGQPYSATEALKLGLIDSLGGFDEVGKSLKIAFIGDDVRFCPTEGDSWE